MEVPMIAASPMTSNSATGCTACHTCPRCSDEQWVWVPITGICAERLDIHLGSRMSSTLRIDELRTPRHPRWGVCYSGVCHVEGPDDGALRNTPTSAAQMPSILIHAGAAFRAVTTEAPRWQ